MSLAHRIATLAEGAGPELIPDGSLRHTAAATEMFAAIAPEVALECHVADERGAVDLTLRLFHEERDALLRDPGALPGAVLRVLRQWSSSPHLARIPFIELELDLATHPDEPWIGPAVEPDVRRGPRAIQAARDGHFAPSGRAPADSALVSHLLDALGGVDEATSARVLRLFAGLPRYGVLSQLALSRQRPSAPREGVRVFVSLPRPCLAATLRGVGWPGDVDALDALLARLAPHGTWADVDFNITASGTEPRLGIYREFQAPRLTDSGLRDVFELIDERRLCEPARCDAIRRWVRHHHGRLDRLLTFKLTMDGGGEPFLKLYLSALDGQASGRP